MLFEQSALQALVVLSLIVAVGLALGKVHFKGVSLGVTWVFFVGIIAGHFGLKIDHQMLVLPKVSVWCYSSMNSD